MDWSAAQYEKFERERSLPIHDLLAKISVEKVSTAIDLGCGPGNSTELLSRRFPAAALTAIDSSRDMLDAARRRLPGVHFELHDIAQWNPADASFDVILANASIQWVPDHANLLPRLVTKLAPGGSLAVQIPDNLGEPAHLLMRKTAANERWAERLAGAGQEHGNRHSAEWYYRALCEVASVDVWRTTYYHVVDGARGIVEWFRGSALKSYLAPLDPEERHSFLAQYEAAIAEAYPLLSDGSVLLPSPRLFFVATRRN